MTCCVAALCDDGKTLILISDRMFTTWTIQSVLDINKLRNLSKHWWVLFSGDDISPVFDILDWTREALEKKCNQAAIDESAIPSILVMDSLKRAYERKRLSQAEALYLTPIHWSVAQFNDKGDKKLPDFMEIKGKIASYGLGLDFLVGGFSSGNGHLFSVSPGQFGMGVTVVRHDVPGFYSVGSGAPGANYMMYYRELSSKTPARKALYYAMEGKIFGEQAGNVSEETDVFVATSDGKFIALDEKKTVEKKLVRVWEKLKPRWIARESADILNDIPELTGFSPIEKDEDGKPFPPPKPKRPPQAPAEGDRGQS
jgi:hypothetical protein